MNYLHEMEALAQKMTQLAQLHGPSYHNKLSQTLLDFSSEEQVKNYIAQSHGYISWNWYVQAIKDAEQKSDYLKENSLIVSSETYQSALKNVQTPQSCEIYTIVKTDPNEDVEKNKPMFFKTHQPVIFGHGWKDSRFLGLWKTRKKAYWKLDNFPLTLFGTSSSGKYYSALTLAQKWIENNEGVILLSGMWNSVHDYNNLLNIVREQNRLDDFYVLKAYEDKPVNKNSPTPLLHTHSIDALNPLIGNIWAFKQLFGENIGLMIHALCQQVKKSGSLVDYQSIKAMLVWDNLKDWLENNHWKEATQSIHNYLQDIRYDMVEHVKHTLKAFKVLDTIEAYTQK